jgi:hypothetical protein
MSDKYNSKERTIIINTMFIIPLEELAVYVLNSGEDNPLLLKYLHNKPLVVEIILEKVIKKILRIQKSRVKLKELKFAYNDSDNFTHGASYFNAKLKGTEKELRILEKSNNFTLFDWEGKE